MRKPIVSVIIPTYNRSIILNRAISSVLSQSYNNIEIIVVDDASKDDTNKMLNLHDDPRLKYISHRINKGASAARNRGIKESKGDLVAFLDDDDEWFPKKLEKQVSLILNSPSDVGLIYCWMDYYNAEGGINSYKPKLKGRVFREVLDYQRIGGCPTLLVKKSVIENVGGFDESLKRGNDGDFIRRVCRKYKVDYVPETLVKVYVNHGEKRISDNNSLRFIEIVKANEIKLDKFKIELRNLPEKRSIIYNTIAKDYIKYHPLYSMKILYGIKFILYSYFIYPRRTSVTIRNFIRKINSIIH